MGSQQTEDVCFVRLPDVLRRVGVKKTKLYDMVQAGEFPRPVKIGKSSVWPDSVIREWQEEKMRGT